MNKTKHVIVMNVLSVHAFPLPPISVPVIYFHLDRPVKYITERKNSFIHVSTFMSCYDEMQSSL